jgi:antitoxin component YwqK of YwqJK toxin-antitoxin module
MKSILFSILFLLVPKLCVSQVITANDDAVYLDSLGNMGTAENYRYIRIVIDYQIPNKEPYLVKDFYKSGKIAMSGATATRIGITKTGPFVYYYENGKRKSIVNYKLNKPYGSYYEFHENGNKKLEGEWSEDAKTVLPNIKIKNYWDENSNQTIKDGDGYYEGFYNNDFKELGKGKIKNNLKDSIWTGENKKFKFTYIENYKNGELISGVSIDSNKEEHKYTVSEVRPIPKKGMGDFNNHIARTFKTPKVEGLKGKIYVSFVVETDGSIDDVKVLRDLGYGTGAEAIRAVKSYKGWIPGEQRGIKVRCKFSLPIAVLTNR